MSATTLVIIILAIGLLPLAAFLFWTRYMARQPWVKARLSEGVPDPFQQEVDFIPPRIERRDAFQLDESPASSERGGQVLPFARLDSAENNQND